MGSKTLEELIRELELAESIELESIPNLDLYMDQVITLFEDKLRHTKRNKDDKLLTKTMINNYTKDKLLMPAVKKKYTKQHIILLILLYHLKHILTISDIKVLFSVLIKQDQIDADMLNCIYQTYLTVKIKSVKSFEKNVDTLVEELTKTMEELPVEVDQKIKNMLLAIMLTEKANYYKRLAEKIIDTL